MLPALRRGPSLAIVTLALVALAAVASACGDGGRPAAVAATLSPAAASAAPSAGATSNGPGQPGTSPSVAATSTPAATAPSSATATPAKPTDASIRADVVRRLGASPTLVGLEIAVRVKKRIVYLIGTVRSQSEKATAEHIAVTEPGIVKVVSLLKVVPGGGGY